MITRSVGPHRTSYAPKRVGDGTATVGCRRRLTSRSVNAKAKLQSTSILCFDYRDFGIPIYPLLDAGEPEADGVGISTMDLQFPVTRESAPDQRKGRTSNALSTALRFDVELGDLPGATSGCRAANQDKTKDGPLAPHNEWMATRFREVFVQVRIFSRVGRTDGSLSVAGQLAEVVVEQAGDGFAILR